MYVCGCVRVRRGVSGACACASVHVCVIITSPKLLRHRLHLKASVHECIPHNPNFAPELIEGFERVFVFAVAERRNFQLFDCHLLAVINSSVRTRAHTRSEIR